MELSKEKCKVSHKLFAWTHLPLTRLYCVVYGGAGSVLSVSYMYVMFMFYVHVRPFCFLPHLFLLSW